MSGRKHLSGRLLRFITAIIAAGAVTFFSTGCSVSDWIPAEKTVDHTASSQDRPEDEQNIPAKETEYGYYGKRLSDEGKQIYTKFIEAIERGELQLTFSDTSVDIIEKAYQAVLNDYSEFFWLANAYQWSEQTLLSSSKVIFDMEASLKTEEIASVKEELRSIIDPLLKQTEGLSEYDKALFIHDFIVENTTYDLDSYVSGKDAAGSDAYTVYGCLKNHLAVCEGYAKTYQMLMKELGLECLYVSGHSLDTGGSHAWNCIRLNGDFYYVDVTWDDPIHSDGTPETLEHDYFCITTEELLETHIIEEGQDVPECTAIACDFYKKQGTYFETYDSETVDAVLKERTERGEKSLAFKFGSSAECSKAKGDLIDNSKIFAYVEPGKSISYRTSKNGRILTLIF